jgi:hypothetical protein
MQNPEGLKDLRGFFMESRMDSALAKKLQLKPGLKFVVLNAPKGYYEKIRSALPENVVSNKAGKADGVLLFATNTAELNAKAAKAIGCVPKDGLLWIAFPKGSSRVQTDLTRDVGWAVIAKAGLGGVRAISIDETWSGMRFRPGR